MSTTTKRGPTVVGAFEDRVQARAAVSALISSGFTDSEVGFTALNDEGKVTGDLTDDDDDDDSYATEGAATGVAAGAGAGALWGLGIVSGMLPAIGPAIAGGTLAAILSSGAAGAAAAGVAGRGSCGNPLGRAAKRDQDIPRPCDRHRLRAGFSSGNRNRDASSSQIASVGTD